MQVTTFTRQDIAAMMAQEYRTPGNKKYEKLIDKVTGIIAAYDNARLISIFNRRNEGMKLVPFGSNRFCIEYQFN